PRTSPLFPYTTLFRSYWAELDANAPDDRKALIIRPAVNFREGHRYAVALRRLRDASGKPIAPGAAFARILGPTLPSGDPLHARQDRKSTRLNSSHVKI